MEARSKISLFVLLTLFCTTVFAQQVDDESGLAPPDPSDFLRESSGQYFVDSPIYESSCDTCATSYDCCEPWRLFPHCDGGWNFYGWLNTGLVANSDDPPSKFNGPYNAVDRANEWMFNQAYFVAEKKLPCDCCGGIGGRIDMIYGEDFFLAQSVGLENHDDGSSHWNGEYYGLAVPQAYVEMGRTDLSLKAGHFYSIIGYEGLPAVGNFFYTKAYSYQFAGPFTHWGGLATWVPSEAWEFQLGVTNGWDTLDREPEDNAHVLAKAKYTGYSGWWTSLGIVSGDDINNPGALPIANALTNRTRYSWLVSLPVCCDVEYVFHHWLGAQDQGTLTGDTAYWYGVDQYLYHTINECWKSGLRFEWFRDEDGTRVGLNRPNNPNKVPFVGNFYSVSAGLNWMPTSNLTVRPELRYDSFDGAQAVQPFNDGTDSSQFLMAIDAILLF